MSEPVVVVGAGLAGLSCARELYRHGVPTIIVEASDDVGGRVRTDLVEGFRLDRGFQVFLTAYPEAAKQLNYERLNLSTFEPGSLIWSNDRLHRLSDPWRQPARVIQTALSPIGGLKDKLLIGLLRLRANRANLEKIFSGANVPTAEELNRLGFSTQMVEQFLRPFLGGIFLDDQLATSSRMLYFVFRMFSRGDTALPALGMGEIPRQIASDLPADSIQLNTRVEEIDDQQVRLGSGNRIPYSKLVIATDETTACRLLPALGQPAKPRPATTIYYSAPNSPIQDRMLVLNGSGSGLVNNLSVPSQISADYGPDGQELISVSVLKSVPDQQSLHVHIQQELHGWFGDSVREWKHLRTYHIPFALPNQEPSTLAARKQAGDLPGDVFVCGDFCRNGSINGALQSGSETARGVLAQC